MAKRIWGHFRGNVVAYAALFFALGMGTAYALDRNSVRSKHIVNGQVKAVDITSPAPWRPVAPGSSNVFVNSCASGETAVFCGTPDGGGGFDKWHNYGSGFSTAGFYKDQLGIVHLKGVVRNLNRSVAFADPQVRTIFRLPPAYRPASQRIFPSVGANRGGQAVAQSRVDVRPNGEVVEVEDCIAANQTGSCSGLGDYVALDGISFRPDG